MPPSLQKIIDKQIAYDAAFLIACYGAAFLLMYFIVLTDMSN